MEREADVQQLRRKAEDLIADLLATSGASPRDSAQRITQLAFQDNNSLQQLFLAAAFNSRRRSVSPAETVRPRGANKALSWLGRGRKEASSEKNAAHHRSQGAGSLGLQSKADSDVKSRAGRQSGLQNTTGHSTTRPVDSRNGNSNDSPMDTADPDPTSRKPSNASGLPPYSCILCNCDLSSKGVCKRHLEDQHVAAKTHACEKCHKPFEDKVEAKKHVATCGGGIFYFITVKPEAKTMYACEFTGDRFLSMKTYVAHLINLSEKREARPEPNMHRKLRALLDQPGLRTHLHEASLAQFRSTDAWKSVEWPEPVVNKTIKQLEFASVSTDSTINLFGQSGQREDQDIRSFLTELLRMGKLMKQGKQQSRCSTAAPEARQSNDSAQRLPQTSSAPPTNLQGSQMLPPESFSAAQAKARHLSHINTMDVQNTGLGFRNSPTSDPMTGIIQPEQTPKRPLSGQSSQILPHRQPPGPPVADMSASYSFQSPMKLYPSHLQTDQPNGNNLTPQSTLSFQSPDAMVLSPHDISSSAAPSLDFSQLSTPSLHSNGSVVLPDTASETTYAQSYHEPELIDPSQISSSNFVPNTAFWTQAQQHANDSNNNPSFADMTTPSQQQFSHHQNSGFPINNIPALFDFTGQIQGYIPPDQSSLRSGSIATTAETYAASLLDERKMSYELHSASSAGGAEFVNGNGFFGA